MSPKKHCNVSSKEAVALLQNLKLHSLTADINVFFSTDNFWPPQNMERVEQNNS